MPIPNTFIFYVRDAAESARFYADLFEIEPTFTSPRYIAFDLGGGVQFAVWSGGAGDLGASRTSELCISTGDGPAQIDELHAQWTAKGLTTVTEPYDDVFGRTFVVADPDGNLIRVAPVD